MNHFMIDIETLDNAPSSLVFDIGIVAFDPVTRESKTLGSIEVKGRSGTIAPETVAWWLAQSPEAQARAARALRQGMSEPTALHHLSRLIRDEEPNSRRIRIWGNGATFDNVILDEMYRRNDIGTPWDYSSHRCYRTIRNLAPEVKVERSGIHHAGVDDAIYQVRTLFAVMDHLGLEDLD